MGSGASTGSSSSTASRSSFSNSSDEEHTPRRKSQRNPTIKRVAPVPARSLDARLYNALGIKTKSRVQYPHLKKSRTESPELNQVRTQVMVMASNVNHLTSESESMRQRIADMKKNLQNVDFGLGICRRAREDSIKKMLDHQLKTGKKRVQVNSTDEGFVRHEKEPQTLSMDELMLACMTSAITENSDDNLDDLAKSLSHLQFSSGEPAPSVEHMDSTVVVITDTELVKNIRKEEEDDDPEKRKRGSKWLTKANRRARFTERLQDKLSRNGSKMWISALITTASILMFAGVAMHFLSLIDMNETVTALRDEAIRLMARPPRVNCPQILPARHGFIKCAGDMCDQTGQCLPGAKCFFSCEDWHRLASATNTTSCTNSGTWDMAIPECIRTHCSQVKNRDCANLFRGGLAPREDGIYTVVHCRTFERYHVYCDSSTMGGGWTVMQERITGKVDFEKTYEDFEKYFGRPTEDYWIGLENIHLLTSTTPQMLLVQMTDWAYPFHQRLAVSAHYKNFKIDAADKGYRLHVSEYEPQLHESQVEAGDSMTISDGMQFTATDSDRDWNAVHNCAQLSGAAWWHRNCTDANLNAAFARQPTYGAKAMYWNTWRVKASVREVRMLIRPRDWQ